MKLFVFTLVTFLCLTACNSPEISPKALPDSKHGIIIKNSLPKGGSYPDSSGRVFGYRIFWTRVINDTTVPLELTINFPADSIKMEPKSNLHLRLFLLPDTMTSANESEFNYGAKGLIPFLDTGLKKPTMLRLTLKPKEEYLFYVGALIYPDGRARAGLLIDGQDLVYAINISPALDSSFIPCGRIIYKK